MSNFSEQKILDRLVNLAVKVSEAKQQAVTEAMIDFTADVRIRIFTNGLNADNQQIGKYSRKPMYVSVDAFKREFGGLVNTGSIKPRGKKNSGDFENGEKRKSMYFPDGYEGLRREVGRPVDKVNLFMTGDTSNDIRLGTTENGLQTGFVSDKGSELSGHLEKKYNMDIFAGTLEEINKIEERFELAVEEAFFSALD